MISGPLSFGQRFKNFRFLQNSIVVIWYVYAFRGDSHKLGKNKRQQLPGAFAKRDDRDHLVLPASFSLFFIPFLSACYNRGQLSGNAIWEMLHCTGFKWECTRWFQNGGIIMPTKAQPTEAYPNQKHNKPPRKKEEKEKKD